MIKYEDVKDMPFEYWQAIISTLFMEFMESFKENQWYEVDTNELAERILERVKPAPITINSIRDRQEYRLNFHQPNHRGASNGTRPGGPYGRNKGKYDK